ncbi:CD209 antigen-like protein C isoform X2 [Onychostoma macrolepis]|uniref:CD209 antigen-like protein C isoform X2 n=1 Tax=Onychostoma macrolepis TaxID=369639 RepID=UPI00272D2391|nr:CD209 antigen-like protein C isoform X2 [Onychostoma macrolepis]
MTGTENQTPEHTGSDCSKAAVVCLGLLCVLLLTAVIVLCVHIYTKSTDYTEERDELLTKITNLTEARNQILTKYINVTNERDGLLIKNDNLTKQKDQFSQLQKVLNETDGWLYSNFSFYFISSLKKSWTESRRYCTERGADLIFINNREEEEFAKKFSHGIEFWIGLTDSDVEGRWKWVDGSNMTSGFWRSGESSGNSADNCVVSFSSGWFDYPCHNAFRWICEKKIYSNELHIHLTTNM